MGILAKRASSACIENFSRLTGARPAEIPFAFRRVYDIGRFSLSQKFMTAPAKNICRSSNDCLPVTVPASLAKSASSSCILQFA